jgi:hypothetical protein
MSPPERESRPGGYSETASRSTARTDDDFTRCSDRPQEWHADLGLVDDGDAVVGDAA